MTEAQQLALVRERLQAIGNCQWAVVREKGGRFLEARMISGQFLRIADFDPGATDAEVTFIEHAPQMVKLLAELVARAAAKVREQAAEIVVLKDELAALRTGPKDYTTEAAMRCAEPRFRKFLAERHGLARDDEEAAAACLRAALGIASRKVLNTDPEAAARWRAMRRAFEAWGRGQ